MIDLHFHCLPGIDDGPGSWDQAVALCRAAEADGTSTIVATPHVLRDPWLNEEPGTRDELILRLNTLLGGKPRILPGCEYWFGLDAVELAEKGEAGPLTRLNRGPYLLVEFMPGFVPREAGAAFHELAVMGLTPVVAHPERNSAFARSPERLGALVEKGAVVQVTAASLAGDLGRGVQLVADDLFASGLVHLVASDAHSTDRRPPRMAAAREWVRKAWGQEAEMGLFDANPAAVLRGEPLPWPG